MLILMPLVDIDDLLIFIIHVDIVITRVGINSMCWH